MNIKISKSSRHCAACENDFTHEQEITSVVRISDGEMVRSDYCRACWDHSEDQKVYSAWTTQYYDPEVAEQEAPETFSPLRQSFYEAVESEDRELLAMAYLAAQMLRRQKVFRLIKGSDKTDDVDATVELFADRLGDRLIEVRDPALTHAELQAGREKLIARLAEIESARDSAEDEAQQDSEESPEEGELSHAAHADEVSQE